MSNVIHSQFPAQPAPRTFPSCAFCDRELTAIENWCACDQMKIAHANHVLEQGIAAYISPIRSALGLSRT
jgi:predicted  nucleic acid-binding Zn ribbon protein